MVLEGRLALTFRELTPKDFYFFNLLNNDYPDITQTHLVLLLLMRLTGLGERDLELIPARLIKHLSDWMGPELLHEKVMTVEQWLELSFHLCKQRWDQSIEWLEDRPVSMILLMSHIQSKHVEKQNNEMERASRRKK